MAAAKGGCVRGAAGCCSPQHHHSCLLPPEEDQDLVLKHTAETSYRWEHLIPGFSAKIKGRSQAPSERFGFRLRFLIPVLHRGKDIYSLSIVLYFILPSCQGTFFADLFQKCICGFSPDSVSHTNCAAEASSPGRSCPSVHWSSPPWGRDGAFYVSGLADNWYGKITP